MRTVVVLICSALACFGQDSYEAAHQKELAAEQLMYACWKTAGPCDAEKAAYWAASDEVNRAIADELRANNAVIEQATAGLREVTGKIERYVACRARRWWQFWKRCRY